MATMSAAGRNRFPFTATQWQELEHQALIFKYMVSGMPIPPDLLYTVKRSFDSTLSSKLLLHQSQHNNIGWNCFQMDFGKKIDPEPGRCRRTDGKKWRCSKEAYPDSKYCERHMHRGRNRSRKPVENMPTSTTTTGGSTRATPTASAISISSITKDSNHSSISPASNYKNTSLPFAYPNSSSTFRPQGLCFSTSQDNNNNTTTNFLLDSSAYSHPGKDNRNRYGDGMKEEVSEHSFLSSSSVNDDAWNLTMASPLGQLNQKGRFDLQQQQQQRQDHHHQKQFYGHELTYNDDDDVNHQHRSKKVMHHFFDEWPLKDKDSWIDSEDKLSTINHDTSLSKTHLSISMPNSAAMHDFFMHEPK